jgi:hypothetical protein
VRFDTVIPESSANPYLEETWTADDGKTYGSFNLFRQREFLKRMYRIFHGGEVKDGLLYLPLAGPPIMAVESFVDIHEVGEGFYQKASTIKEAYPQEMVRVWMTAEAYGFLVVNNLKNLKSDSGLPLTSQKRIGALLAAGADPRLSGRPGLYDFESDGKTIRTGLQIWEAWSWVDRVTAQWWPHWKNSGLISTSGSGEYYVSFYLQPGRRILLVASNYENSPEQVTLKLNKKALGFPDNTTLEAQDALTSEAVPVKNNALSLSVGPELYRLIKIAPADELQGPNLDREHSSIREVN